MSRIHYHIRNERKLSHLTQQDIADLFDVKDTTKFSRIESGIQPLDAESMLIYHLLYDIPLYYFFKELRDELRKKFLKNAPDVVYMIEQQEKTPRTMRRREHIASVFNRYQHYDR